MTEYFCSFCNKYIKKNYWEYYCEDCTRVKSLVKTISSKKLLESVKIKFIETELEENKKDELDLDVIKKSSNHSKYHLRSHDK